MKWIPTFMHASPLFTNPNPGITLGAPKMAKRWILNIQIHTRFNLEAIFFGKIKFSDVGNFQVIIHWKQFNKRVPSYGSKNQIKKPYELKCLLQSGKLPNEKFMLIVCLFWSCHCVMSTYSWCKVEFTS